MSAPVDVLAPGDFVFRSDLGKFGKVKCVKPAYPGELVVADWYHTTIASGLVWQEGVKRELCARSELFR